MIFRRIFAIIFDLFLALIAAVGAYLGGFDFLIFFVILYFISTIGEVIYFKNQSLGMVVFNISPKNKNGTDASIGKLITYQIALTIMIANIFNPLVDIYTKIFLYILLLFPFNFQGKYNSFFDLFFNLHWVRKT
ncbi:MAG: hypothetical protein GF353_08560 [Candidatus Lokiarchaeota archaeon]|nr:hypothetical protein [Candidatus Lokiarchaeota archaeon]